MSNQHLVSLYRAYLCQVNILPHAHLRYFFRIKGSDDFRSALKSAESVELCRKKLKRISKDLQYLRAANNGESAAFDRILDIAYGRVGRLRWELMESLLRDTNTSPHNSENPRISDTCSLSHSPELVALLTSSISRTAAPLQKHHLVDPPRIRGLAKSGVGDAVLSGSPSSRREYNTRWRLFKNECKKVYPPLNVSLPHSPACHSDTRMLSNLTRNFGFQSANTLQELLALASPETPEVHMRQDIQLASGANPFDRGLSSRWLRRRYQALLGRVPLLVLRTPTTQDGSKHTYDVQLADKATTSRIQSSRLRFVDTKDVSWIGDFSLMV